MTKPDDIPQDVWDAARDVVKRQGILATARAIMAEREACATLVEELLAYADTTSRADAVIAAAIRNRQLIKE